MTVSPPCPCGSQIAYAACCEPWHDGLPAPTAEAVMRSRYAAYVLGREDHLLRTWHPRTRPDRIDVGSTQWIGLRILAVEAGSEGDATGVVEFEARHRGGVLHERSRFERRHHRWVYVDGDVMLDRPVSRRRQTGS